jgi:nitroreductase
VFTLPAPETPDTTIGDVVARRRSVRSFQRKPVPAAKVAGILAYAHHCDADAWPRERSEGRPLRFIVLAQAVSGLDPSAYEYLPDQHAVAPMARRLSATEFATFFLQKEFSAAPAAIWIVGDLAAACARHGEFGHRQLLLRAGHAGHRLWMGAIAHGLGGCLIGGMVAGAGRESIHLDGYWSAGLLGFALGFEA